MKMKKPRLQRMHAAAVYRSVLYYSRQRKHQPVNGGAVGSGLAHYLAKRR